MSQGFDYRIPEGNFDLPERERRLAETIGRSNAIALSVKTYYLKHIKRDGCRSGVLYIPKIPTSKFIEFVGDSGLATALSQAHGGEQMQLLGCRSIFRTLRALWARELVAQGAKKKDVAKFAGVTARCLHRWCLGDPRIEPWPIAKQVARVKELDALRCQINYEPTCWHGDRESETDEW